MDGAGALNLYSTVDARILVFRHFIMYRRVGRARKFALKDVVREHCREADFSADLGGSSKYSNENFEGSKWRRVPCEQQLNMGQSILS